MVDDLTITAVNGKNSGTEQYNLCPGIQGAALYEPATIALKTGSPPIMVNVNVTYTPYCPPTTASCPVQLLPLPSDVGRYFQAQLQLDNSNGTADTSAPGSGVINMTSTLATAGSNGIDATATVPLNATPPTEYTLSVALVKYPTPGVGTFTYNIDPNDNASFIFDAGQTSPYPTISVNLISTGGLAVVTTPPPASTNQNTGTVNTCEASGGPLSWIMCGIIDTVNSAENDLMTGVVQPLLQTKPLAFNADCSAAGSNCTSNDELGSIMYSVWSNFRVFGDVILVIALLVIVFGEAIGGGLIDAYTAKKILPRILIAAILINLSIYIVAALEDVFNVIGGGLDSLIRLPFENVAAIGSAMHGLSQAQVTGGVGVVGAVLFAILAYGIFTGAAVPFLLFAAGALLLATIGVLVTLAIRQGLIIFLVLISPIAFALYCLPNTEQYFKKWWSLLVKTLMVYPIVMVVFAMSYVLGVVMTNFGVHPQILADIMSLIAMVAPLFMIPFAFKMSGGIIASVQGAVTGLKSRATKPMGAMARQKSAESWQRAKSGGRFKGGNSENFRGRLNRAIMGSTMISKAGFRPTQMRTKLRQATRTASEAQVGDLMQGKNASFNSWSGDDAKVSAAQFNKREQIEAELARFDPGRYAGSDNATRRAEAAADIMQTKREVGDEVLQRARVRAQAKTGTGYQYKHMVNVKNADGEDVIDENTGKALQEEVTDVDYSKMADDINSAYGSDRNGAGRALAEMKTSLLQSGQIGGAAGYGVWATQMEELYRHPGDANARRIAHEKITDDARASSPPGQAVYGRQSSARALGESQAREIARIAAEDKPKIEAALNNVNNVEAVQGTNLKAVDDKHTPIIQNAAAEVARLEAGVQPGTSTPELSIARDTLSAAQAAYRTERAPVEDTAQEALARADQQLAASQSRLSAAMAAAAGVWDAMGQASPNNASAYASKLMSMDLSKVKGLDSSPIGSLLTQRDQKTGKTDYVPEVTTVREYIQTQMAGNQEFVNRRHDIGQSTLSEARYFRQQQQNQQPGIGGLPQQPGAPTAPYQT
jgi:hypothetical protein